MNASSTISLSIPLSARKESLARLRFFFSFLKVSLVASALPLLLYCAFQINREIAERYSLGEAQALLEQRISENYALEEKMLVSNSSQNLDSLVSSLGFERIQKTSYIKVSDNQVSAK